MQYVYYDEYKKAVTFRIAPSTQHGTLIGKIADADATTQRQRVAISAALLEARRFKTTGLTVSYDDSPAPINTTDVPDNTDVPSED